MGIWNFTHQNATPTIYRLQVINTPTKGLQNYVFSSFLYSLEVQNPSSLLFSATSSWSVSDFLLRLEFVALWPGYIKKLKDSEMQNRVIFCKVYLKSSEVWTATSFCTLWPIIYITHFDMGGHNSFHKLDVQVKTYWADKNNYRSKLWVRLM